MSLGLASLLSGKAVVETAASPSAKEAFEPKERSTTLQYGSSPVGSEKSGWTTFAKGFASVVGECVGTGQTLEQRQAQQRQEEAEAAAKQQEVKTAEQAQKEATQAGLSKAEILSPTQAQYLAYARSNLRTCEGSQDLTEIEMVINKLQAVAGDNPMLQGEVHNLIAVANSQKAEAYARMALAKTKQRPPERSAIPHDQDAA